MIKEELSSLEHKLRICVHCFLASPCHNVEVRLALDAMIQVD